METSDSKAKLENFEKAFTNNYSGCRRTCGCGREFWDGYNRGYSWEDGEIEALEKNPNATVLEHSVGTIEFEGREYVMDCDCWHPRAEKLMGFIDGHANEIAKYLTLEKQRKKSIADSAPIVQ